MPFINVQCNQSCSCIMVTSFLFVSYKVPDSMRPEYLFPGHKNKFP
jgi:hypothetical protein